MNLSPNRAADFHRLGDHSADSRMLLLAIMATIAGSGGALGAWGLLKLIAIATNLFWFGRLSDQASLISDNTLGAALVFIPVIGSIIVGLMARYGSEKIRGHGIPEAIETILYGESKLSVKVALLKPLSSAISIGSGGPFGAEGPIIMTGGAIGSLFAQRFNLSAAERKTLLVSGAAAGMTAIFGTPLAAVLLAIEVLLFEWKPRSFVPVVVAVLVSLAWRPMLIGVGPLFPFAGSLPTGLWPIAAAIGIGLIVGFQSVVLSKALYWIEDIFHMLPVHWMWWPAIGGVFVGIGGLLDPLVLGAGYSNIQGLLNGSFALKAALLLLAIKASVWLSALGSGTSGGVLAPLLILGGAAGYIVGQLLPGTVGIWTMLGMAGIMSGAMRAPLTGAIFACELTGHFDALTLSIASASAAYGVSVLIMQRSILTERISRRGRHVLQEYTVDPLEFLQASHIMTAPAQMLQGDMPIDAVNQFFNSSPKHRSYPVVDDCGRLLGLASRNDALRWQRSEMLLEGTLSEHVSDASLPIAYTDTPAGIIADLIIDSGLGRIPIVDRLDRRVLGIVSRHDLLKARSQTRRTEKPSS
jgi:H+/Cl- antiporter ClcA